MREGDAREHPLAYAAVLAGLPHQRVVFVLGTVTLALAPVTVSARILASEATVLALGLTTILVLNALLLGGRRERVCILL